MDILNFISWIRGGRVVTSVDPNKTLIPVGLKDGRRDDDYLAGAISVTDFTTQVGNTVRPYKVFTALLTQSGGDNLITLNSGLLTIGATYWINESDGVDFTNVGAPNNETNTYFIATGTTPNSWGPHEGDPSFDILLSNTGAPVAIVLENTIGNVWFTYQDVGNYNILSNELFTENKTLSFIGTVNDNFSPTGFFEIYYNFNSQIQLLSFDMTSLLLNGQLGNTPIEIRVYN